MDYYIRRVLINDLFETNNNYKIDLFQGCNCIYGGNGTGKTTIINLIVNSLNVEIESISKTPFSSLTISLAKSGQSRAFKFLKVSRQYDPKSVSTIITYEVDGTTPYAFVVNSRARCLEPYTEVIDGMKKYIYDLVNLTHVPLLRMHDSELFGMRDERDEFLHTALRSRNLSQTQINEIFDPSARVLNSLQRQFTAEANEARKSITEKLEVLKSKIIEKVMIDESLVKLSAKAMSRVSKALTTKLEDVDVSAYIRKFQDVKISVPEEKIREHFETWKKLNDGVRDAFKEMETARVARDTKNTEQTKKNYADAVGTFNTAYFSLIAMANFNDRFLSITEDVESMQEEKFELTKSFRDYEKEVNSYFSPRKTFAITEDGLFRVKSKQRKVELSDLSSGEKHILTILGKAALSRKDGAIFIADEPELSLHLDWQRMILPSIIKLSPKSQIIVATHSPSINAKGAAEIDLEECR